MMRFRHLCMLLPAAALLLATVSCSCGTADRSAQEEAPAAENNEKPAPPAADHKQKLPVQQRLAALKELQQKFDSLPGKDFEADNKSMLNWLQGRPEYEASGISKSGSVWARFTDGRVVGLLRSQDAKGRPIRGSGGGGQSSPGQDPKAYAQDDKKSMFMMPSSRQVRICSHPTLAKPDRSGTTEVLPAQVEKWFEAAGYTVAHGDATIEGLIKTSGDGVFYFDTHGGNFPIGGEDVVDVASNTEADDEHEVLYADDLKENRIHNVVIRGYPGLGLAGWYAFTPSFVTEHMSFADNAFVFLNGCDTAANESMRNACFEKGASVYAGWTTSIGDDQAYRASVFLFDRLLAANRYVPEAPKQRPFEFGAVYRDMRSRNYDTGLGLLSDAEKPPFDDARAGAPQDPSPASQLTRDKATSLLAIHHKSGHVFTGLRPSIAELVVFETLEELHLLGYFGARQGSVKINGHAVTVKSWKQDTVTVALPSSGPGSAGPVVVEVDGRQSNTVPLTEWRGQFRYTQEDNSNGPSLKKTATFTLHIRHDVHAYRLVPHEEPHANSAKRGFTLLSAAKDSKVEWAFSGNATSKNFSYELTGSGALTLAEVKKDGPYFSLDGKMDAELKEITRAELNVAGNYGTRKFTSLGKTSESGEGIAGSLPDIGTLKLDTKFTIKSGKVVRDQGKIHSQLEWDDIPAKHLPEADTLAVAPQPNWQFAGAARVTQLDGLLVGPPRRLAERGPGR
jgi:hypothetical protein